MRIKLYDDDNEGGNNNNGLVVFVVVYCAIRAPMSLPVDSSSLFALLPSRVVLMLAMITTNGSAKRSLECCEQSKRAS